MVRKDIHLSYIVLKSMSFMSCLKCVGKLVTSVTRSAFCRCHLAAGPSCPHGWKIRNYYLWAHKTFKPISWKVYKITSYLLAYLSITTFCCLASKHYHWQETLSYRLANLPAKLTIRVTLTGGVHGVDLEELELGFVKTDEKCRL